MCVVPAFSQCLYVYFQTVENRSVSYSLSIGSNLDFSVIFLCFGHWKMFLYDMSIYMNEYSNWQCNQIAVEPYIIMLHYTCEHKRTYKRTRKHLLTVKYHPGTTSRRGHGNARTRTYMYQVSTRDPNTHSNTDINTKNSDLEYS